MPRGTGTGPMGMGGMTGRGAGFCAGFSVPGYANSRNFRLGLGGGRGFRRIFYATGLPRWARLGYFKDDDAYEPTLGKKELLSRRAEFLGNQLRQVKKQLLSFKEDAE